MRHVLFLVVCSLSVSVVGADWTQYRGGPQRTGNLDGQAGPATGKVLWAEKLRDDLVASPVVVNDQLFVSGLGAFNTSNFHAMAAGPKPAKRSLWLKSVPFLKLPTVSSPVVADGLVIFGDGMHQTDGATLYGVKADSGLPLWQYPVPGQLVHLEGSPAMLDGKVFIGGGNAGVICVDSRKLTLDGKDIDAATAQKTIEQRWKQMLAAYEEDKKKDPDFAIPPSEDSLPKPRPVKVWQQGLSQWHVDAAVTVVGNKVLAASAYLDAEKCGERALFGLNAADGTIAWKMPLKYNPWAGAAVAGDVAIVGCSNIRFDPKEIPHGKGEVVAVALSDGKPAWRIDVPGGVLSSAAIQGGLAIFTASDGKVRAIEVAGGKEKWAYDAKAALFAGPAVAGGRVYVADLKGVVHAINLADGKGQWTLNLATDPAVQATGMVYGSPVVQGGRLYVVTCNLEIAAGATQNAIVCIGDK